MGDKYIRNEIKEIIIYLFIGLMATIVIPIFAGLSLRGFEESFESGIIAISSYLGTFLIYVFFIIGSLFVIIYPLASLLTIRKGEHPATQENPTWFRIFTVSYIFNPENGALWKLSEAIGLKGDKNIMRWSKKILRVFIVAIIIFGFLGVAQVLNPALNVVGVPEQAVGVAQQIGVASDITFGAGVPSFSENGMMFLVFLLLEGIIAYVTAKFIKDKKLALLTFFVASLLIIAPFMGLLWMSIHSIVYGNSEASLFATFLFGYIGTTMTILTGVFVFWFIWHFMNNLFIKITDLASTNEDIIFIASILLLGTLGIWLGIEFWLWKIRKGKPDPESSF